MTLYLGLRPKNKEVIHFPLIRIVPRQVPEAFANFSLYTHVVFTSQSAAEICFQANLKNEHLIWIAVGKETKRRIEEEGYVAIAPEEETAEGLIARLDDLDLRDAFLFWPHSALSRPLLIDYFERRKLRHCSPVLYDTEFHLPGPLPPLDEIEEIVFTSPSTVHAFLHFFGSLPKEKKLTPIGPVTKKTLMQSLTICYGGDF